jgi:hypothetical protein
LKSIPAENVEKRATSDYIVKGLVCLQALWLVAQVIGRAVAKLPTTTLEVVTVGYVVCALIKYGCWWHKPQDVKLSITINCRDLTKERFHEQMRETHAEPERERWWEKVLRCVTCTTFGAVHCIAWNFFFSTFAERVIWRLASVLTVVLPLLITANLVIQDLGEFTLMVLTLVYVPVRLYLMVEPFVTFRSVPVGIFYTVDWSSWIPHV